MTRRRPLTTGAVAAVLALSATACTTTTVAGCAIPPEAPLPMSDAPPATTPPTGAPYVAPSAAPAPRSVPPVAVRGEVEVSDGDDGLLAQAAVAGPDGGAFVVLTPEVPGEGARLVAVGQREDGDLGVTGQLRLPVETVYGLHALPGGELLVSGQFRASRAHAALSCSNPPGYGYAVVDPDDGAVGTTVVIPYGGTPDAIESSWGMSSLSADGATLYLSLSRSREYQAEISELLLAIDVTSGEVLARDVDLDLGELAVPPDLTQITDLVMRPGGGVDVLVSAPVDEAWTHVLPLLLRYTADLRPEGTVALDDSGEAWVSGPTVGDDGTLFVNLQDGGGGRVVAVAEGSGTVTTVAEHSSPSDQGGLLVSPDRRWALVPEYEGVRAIDLVRGSARGAVRIDCLEGSDGMAGTSQPVGIREIVFGADASEALLLGQCDTLGAAPQMLWFVGP
jgi:hypothetical protein